MTQQRVGDEIGWSREKVAQYAQLEKVSPIVWKLIVTTFSNMVPIDKNGVVTENVTVVPIITERLLRNILNLAEIPVVVQFIELRSLCGLVPHKLKSSVQINKLAYLWQCHSKLKCQLYMTLMGC